MCTHQKCSWSNKWQGFNSQLALQIRVCVCVYNVFILKFEYICQVEQTQRNTNFKVMQKLLYMDSKSLTCIGIYTKEIKSNFNISKMEEPASLRSCNNNQAKENLSARNKTVKSRNHITSSAKINSHTPYMNFTKLQLEIKACTLPKILSGSWFGAFQLDAHDVVFNRKTMLTMHKTHIQLW